jgi:transposase
MAAVLRLSDGSRAIRQIADELGISRGYVYGILWRLRKEGQIPHTSSESTGRPPLMSRANNDARNHEMAAAVADGETFAAVGKRYDLTRERVRQIVKRAGVKSARSSPIVQQRRLDRLAAKAALRATKEAADTARAEKMRELVAGGKSILEAARMLGVSRGQIFTLNKQAGLSAITRHGRHKKAQP